MIEKYIQALKEYVMSHELNYGRVCPKFCVNTEMRCK